MPSTHRKVLAPDELVTAICKELIYYHGLTTITSFLNIVKQYVYDDTLVQDAKYMRFILGNILQTDYIVLLHNGTPVKGPATDHIDGILESVGENNESAFQIKMTDEKLWRILVGKSCKESNIGLKGFQLLLYIVAAREKGIDAVTLTELSKQDARSISGRFKKMGSLVVMKPLIHKGHVTKHITYYKFAQPTSGEDNNNNNNNNGKGVEVENVSKKILASEIVQRLKYSKNKIRQIIDLRRELQFDSKKSLQRRFLAAYSWLSSEGYVKKIVVISGINKRQFLCLQYVKDIEEAKTAELDDEDDDEDDDFGEGAEAGAEANEDGDMEEEDEDEGDIEQMDNQDEDADSSQINVKFEKLLEEQNVIIKETDSSFENTRAVRKQILFNKFYTDQTLIHSFVESKGTRGATTMELLASVFGEYMKNPFYRRLETYVTEPQDISKIGNGFRVIRVFDFQGRKKFYRLFCESAYREHFLKSRDHVPCAALPEIEIQRESLKNLNTSICATFPLVLGSLDLPDGSSHHVWHHHLGPSMKKTRQKRKKLNQLQEELTEQSAQSKKLKPDPSSTKSQNPPDTKKLIRMGEFVGTSYRSIQLQQALLSIVRKNDGIYHFSDKNYQEDIATELDSKTLVDRKTMKRDIGYLKDSGKINLILEGSKLYVTLPEISKDSLSEFAGAQTNNTKQPASSKWEISNKNELTFFDQSQHNRFYKTKSMKRIAAYQENENKQKKKEKITKMKAEKVKPAPIVAKFKQKVIPQQQPLLSNIETSDKGKVNVHTKEGIDTLLKACIISQSIKKKIEWARVAKIFTQDLKVIQKNFISKKKKLGSDYFREERLKWKQIMINAVREDLASVEDAENLNLEKLVDIWKRHQIDVKHKTVVLYKDIKRNHQKYGFVKESAPPIFDLSIAKSSMTKRFQTLMRNPFSVPESQKTLATSTETEEKIKSVIRSLLIEGKNCEIDIAEKHLKQYSDDEINTVIGNLVKEKIISLNGSSEFHLTDYFNEFVEKHDKLEFFQNLSKFMEKFKNISNESMGVLLTKEPHSTMVAGCFELMEKRNIRFGTIPSLYTPTIEEDLDYVGKKTRARSFEEPLIVVKCKSFDVKPARTLKRVPGLGIPYSRVWIDGSGQVRSAIWEKSQSMILFQIMFKPGVTQQSLAEEFGKFLSTFEVADIVQWYVSNHVVYKLQHHGTNLSDAFMVVNNPLSSGIFA